MSSIHTITGLLLSTSDATTVTIAPPTGQEPYQAIHELLKVDTFDIVSLHNGIDLYVDDEGAINGSALNLQATLLAHAFGSGAVLFGPALVLATDRHGNSSSLSRAKRKAVTSTLRDPRSSLLAELMTTIAGVGMGFRP